LPPRERKRGTRELTDEVKQQWAGGEEEEEEEEEEGRGDWISREKFRIENSINA